MATTTRARRGKRTRRPPARRARWSPPHLGRPSAEVCGAVLVLAGLLDALGTWADLTGPLGRALRAAGGLTVGSGRVVLPVVLVAYGVALVVLHGHEHTGRRSAGALVIALAGVGLLHISEGSPRISAPRHLIEHAGGYIGALVADPLHAGLATWGATLVLLALAAVGALLAADCGPRAGGAAVGRAAVVTG